MDYTKVQAIAKQTIEYIQSVIEVGMHLREVRSLCEQNMLSLGADSFWYWDIGAFVFSGDETSVSVSGQTYQTSDRTICENDLITIDLSPCCKSIWGDYARTVVIENGKVVNKISDIKRTEWKNGLLMEERLHDELCCFATPNTTFEELYEHINTFIVSNGFINLDFLGNLGHSIETRKQDRIYIEKGNQRQLGDVRFFTFEPHISVYGSKYGYKKENIYFFQNGKIKEL